MLYGLGNKDKEKHLDIFCIGRHFFLSVFDPDLVESMDPVPTVTED
jgi:hypothetical protein